jgi:eukaryotic-like serine/threonine-protein kinase
MEGLRPGDPQRVGRYRLVKRLGVGGMGQVYLGQSPSGRPVAVKIIRAELADDADFRQRFREEVRAARRVGGMFTAPVVDADPDAPQPWMVTGFVGGPSLADAVAARGPLSVGAVRTLAAGLAEGLSEVHAVGLVHRDLKPSNVLLASDGPRIIDFGISRSAGSVGLTSAGGIIGSPGYMSPEQATGEPVGPASDVYSLGGVLAFAATGEPPFGVGPPSALLYRVVFGEPSTVNIPPELLPLIARCLARDPAVRPTTDELLAELGDAAPAAGWLGWQDSGSALAARSLRAVPSDGWREPDPADDGIPAVPVRSFSDGGLPGARARLALVPVAVDAAEPELAVSRTDQQPGGLPGDAAFLTAPLDPSRASPPASPAPGRAAGQPATGHPPGRHARKDRRAALAGAGALCVVIAGALAFFLLSRPGPSQHIAGQVATEHAGPAARAHRSARVRTPAGGQDQAPRVAGTNAPSALGGPGASATTGSSGTPTSPAEAGPVTVVLAYFTAINNGDWQAAWALGGDNLYPSLTALVSGNADVSHQDVTIVSSSGDTVVARVATIRIMGFAAAQTQTFVVENGAIVSRAHGPFG